MARKNLLSGISLADVDIEATGKLVTEALKRETPHLKKGFRSVEHDVEKTVKTLYDLAAGDDEEDVERDLLAKLLG